MLKSVLQFLGVDDDEKHSREPVDLTAEDVTMFVLSWRGLLTLVIILAAAANAVFN